MCHHQQPNAIGGVGAEQLYPLKHADLLCADQVGSIDNK
jgi:hypothetical protein